MQVEAHLKNLRESLEVIDESIEKGLVERQRNIGFNTSAACADMIELLLHKKSLIDPGFVVKHEWFKSKNKLLEKFPFEFSGKTEIIALASKIEEKRNTLCYGKPQKPETIQEILDNFNLLKEKLREAGLNDV